MKTRLKAILQLTLGFHRYLVLHSIIVAHTIRLRRNEGAVLTFLSMLAVDANILDVGANVGAMTLLFGRKCPRGNVFAFEPIPENIKAAKTVLRLFRVSNAKLFEFGIGEREENVVMVMPSVAKNVRLQGLSHVVNAGCEKVENGTLYTVHLAALDHLDVLKDLRVDAIKIDVEDHERFVLRGGRSLIARERPLIYCELWGGKNKSECIEMLANLDYDLFFAEHGKLVPCHLARRMQVNYFFVPRERCDHYLISRSMKSSGVDSNELS